MDIPISKKMPVYREERFRTPSELEYQFGLWVDRIGEQTRHHKIPYLRKLGQYAAVLIEKGHGKMLSLPREECEVKSGDVIVLFPDEAVAYNPEKEWAEKWIVWNGPEAIAFENAGFVKKSCFIIKGKQTFFLEAFNSLRSLIDLQEKSAILERKVILTKFILDLYKAKVGIGPKCAEAEYIESAVNFLTSNYSSDLSVDRLASQYNISASHFRSLFKDYTGTSPRKFVTNLRISEAKKLLVQGLSVKQTARNTGFDDIFYFIRVFKSSTGRSPGVWQKSHLGF